MSEQGEYAVNPEQQERVRVPRLKEMYIPEHVIKAAEKRENKTDDDYNLGEHDWGLPWELWDTENERVVDVIEPLEYYLTRNENFINRYDTTPDKLDSLSRELKKWRQSSKDEEVQQVLSTAIQQMNDQAEELERNPNPEQNAKKYIARQIDIIYNSHYDQETDPYADTGDVISEHPGTMVQPGARTERVRSQYHPNRHYFDQMQDNEEKFRSEYQNYLSQFDELVNELPEDRKIPKDQLDKILYNIDTGFNNFGKSGSIDLQALGQGPVDMDKVNEAKQKLRQLAEAA